MGSKPWVKLRSNVHCAWLHRLGGQRRESKEPGAGGGGGRCTALGNVFRGVWPPSCAGRKNKLEWNGIHDLPAAQILRHCRPAAEQIGSERFQLLSQSYNSGQWLCVEVQHGVLLLDVDQGLFVHILQKLLGLLGHLQNKLWPSVLVNHPQLSTPVFSAWEPHLGDKVVVFLYTAYGRPTHKGKVSLFPFQKLKW